MSTSAQTAAELVPLWVFDPGDVSSNASDGNAGTTTSAPLRSWAEVNRRYGTQSPTLRQATTWQFLSSQPSDGSDPIVFCPTIIGSVAASQFVGALTQVATGTLSNVTPKNRAAGQLLQANLGASAAFGMLVHNVTRDTRAWLFKNVSGTIWSLSQTFSPISVSQPLAPNYPTLLDTWANGDAFVLYSATSLTFADLRTSGTNVLNRIGRALAVIDANIASVVAADAALGNTVNIGRAVSLIECIAQSNVNIEDARTSLLNCCIYSPASNMMPNLTTEIGSNYTTSQIPVIGGIINPSAGYLAIDGDCIVSGPQADEYLLTPCSLKLAYLDTGITKILGSGQCGVRLAQAFYGVVAIWGPGQLYLRGTPQLAYNGQTAVATFLNAGGITIQGSTQVGDGSGVCAISQANPAVLYGNVPLTPANLDASPAGPAAFDGNAFVPGCGSVVNTPSFT